MGPDHFIDVAESSGLIHPLGQFVLRKACEDLLASSDISLCVNVSPAQFRDPAFEARVAAVLKETGFPPKRLELENNRRLSDRPPRTGLSKPLPD